MSDRPIATVEGTMLVPGVSRNMRLYSKEVIAKAVNRMQARIADPNGLPIVMRTHHQAEDNSAMIVGRLTNVALAEDGSARYSALLYDTQAGRDIAALVTPKQPALKSVSIHGYWLGPLKRVEHEGESVTTGDDLEIDAVDWTATPGVVNATVHNAAWLTGRPSAESVESAGLARTPISESVEATITAITDEPPTKAAPEANEAWRDEAAYRAFVEEADYTQKQKDKMVGRGAMRNAKGNGSYPIQSKSDLRKAIRAVGRGGANHNAIRRHVIARARALGLSGMIPDNWNSDGSLKESATRFGEIREYMGSPEMGGGGAGFCLDAFNGPVCLTLRAGCLDPSDLRAAAAAAMDAACNALQSLDPDMDADIDVDGVDTDGDESTVQWGVVTLNEMREAYGAPAPPGGDITVTLTGGIPTASRVAPGAAPVPQTITVPISGTTVNESDIRDVAVQQATVQRGRQYEGGPAFTDDTPEETGETSSTEEVPAVSEATSTTQATETTAQPAQPARTLTDADISALGSVFAAALKEHAATVSAAVPAVETTSAPPSGTAAEQVTTASAETLKAGDVVSEKALLERASQIETDLKTKLNADFAARETAMRDAVLAEVRAELLRANGIPGRKGYRVHENEQTLPDPAALFEDRATLLLGNFGKTPVPEPGTGAAPAPTPTQPEVPAAS